MEESVPEARPERWRGRRGASVGDTLGGGGGRRRQVSVHGGCSKSFIRSFGIRRKAVLSTFLWWCADGGGVRLTEPRSPSGGTRASLKGAARAPLTWRTEARVRNAEVVP